MGCLCASELEINTSLCLNHGKQTRVLLSPCLLAPDKCTAAASEDPPLWTFLSLCISYISPIFLESWPQTYFRGV